MAQGVQSQGDYIIDTNYNYVFMGDYVNRGKMSTEVIVLMLALKVRYPKKIWILRGNHETQNITHMYGFYDEIIKRYNSEKLYKQILGCFIQLPTVGLIEQNVLCMHGGIPSDSLADVADLNKMPKGTYDPDTGMQAELMWNDPDKDVGDWIKSNRGTGKIFGTRPLN